MLAFYDTTCPHDFLTPILPSGILLIKGGNNSVPSTLRSDALIAGIPADFFLQEAKQCGNEK